MEIIINGTIIWINNGLYIYIYGWLVVLTILKKYENQLGRMILNIWENKKCLKPPTSILIWII